VWGKRAWEVYGEEYCHVADGAMAHARNNDAGDKKDGRENRGSEGKASSKGAHERNGTPITICKVVRPWGLIPYWLTQKVNFSGREKPGRSANEKAVRVLNLIQSQQNHHRSPSRGRNVPTWSNPRWRDDNSVKIRGWCLQYNAMEKMTYRIITGELQTKAKSDKEPMQGRKKLPAGKT